jgi:hypothetical protein
MISAIINFDNWKCGDSVEAITFALLKNNAPVNLTGSLIRCYFRKEEQQAAALKLTTENSGGITILDAVNGTFRIDEIKSLQMEAGIYDYDIEVTDINGVVDTYVKGTVEVEQDVTY